MKFQDDETQNKYHEMSLDFQLLINDLDQLLAEIRLQIQIESEGSEILIRIFS